MITPANATQLPAVICQKFQVGVGDAEGFAVGEAAVLGECEGEGVCVGEAAGVVLAVGFGAGEDFAVGEATGLAAGGFGFWATLVLASKKLNKTVLEAKTRF
jgi:hypothetical protein